MIIALSIAGCDNSNEFSDKSDSTYENSNLTDSSKEEIQILNENKFLKESLDLDQYFGATKGTAIFYNPSKYEYVYNEDLIDTRFTPNSTFKIVSTLMGLNEGIIETTDSKMQYNGTTYWYDLWNENLTLEEAFQTSCVWYYHQMLYQVPRETVQEQLNLLSYGNSSISQWEGNGTNSKEDLNGFWLNSSLKISPKEQVLVLEQIFEYNTIYEPKHIELLKTVMDTKTQSVYAKTGSGGGQAWYVGFIEQEDDIIYFAIFIEDEGVSGALAKEISFSIIKDLDILIENF